MANQDGLDNLWIGQWKAATRSREGATDPLPGNRVMTLAARLVLIRSLSKTHTSSGRRKALTMLGIGFTLAGTAYAQAQEVRNGLDVEVPVAPVPFHLNDALYVGYEVHLTNFSDDRLKITDLSVRDASDGRQVTDLRDRSLTAATMIVGTSPKQKVVPEYLEPGQRAVVFLDVALPEGGHTSALTHRITYTVADTDATSTVFTDPLKLSTVKPSIIAPPLRGGPWVAIHSTAWPRGHRRVFYTIASHAKLPGRFAIDFVKVDEQGRLTRGDPDVAAQMYGFGDDVLAVADATVVAVRDGMQDPTKISERTTHKPADDAGNYVTLRLPDGRFAFYEHLENGSIRVAVGDKVTTGKVLGSLGFTGESTGPHLHFHIADANSTLNAESLPFEIRNYRQLGQYKDISRLGTQWDRDEEATARQNQWPDYNAVVNFDP